VITDRSIFHQVSRLFGDDDSRWRGALVSYNAGYGTILQRRALAIRKGVPHDRWTGGLDQVALGYESKHLYGRPLAQMRNEYPRLICDVRAPKYIGWL
jgi:membrane-bound lytic murein transglycosylase MltF